jgi:hypothetical protein
MAGGVRIYEVFVDVDFTYARYIDKSARYIG